MKAQLIALLTILALSLSPGTVNGLDCPGNATITEFFPPVATLDRGVLAQATVRLRNDAECQRKYWVGLSFAEPDAGIWPHGWYDIPPIETGLIEPGQETEVTFDFLIQWWMIPGDYTAVTALWEGFDEEENLMVEPRYHDMTLSSFHLGEYTESDVYGERVYPPHIVTSWDQPIVINQRLDQFQTFIDSEDIWGPKITIEEISPGRIRVSVDNSELQSIDYYMGVGRSQLILIAPNSAELSNIEYDIDGTTRMQWNAQLALSLATKITGPADNLIVYIVNEIRNKILSAALDWATDFLDPPPEYEYSYSDDYHLYSFDFDAPSAGTDYQTFQDCAIEFDVAYELGQPKPINIVADLRYALDLPVCPNASYITTGSAECKFLLQEFRVWLKLVPPPVVSVTLNGTERLEGSVTSILQGSNLSVDVSALHSYPIQSLQLTRNDEIVASSINEYLTYNWNTGGAEYGRYDFSVTTTIMDGTTSDFNFSVYVADPHQTDYSYSQDFAAGTKPMSICVSDLNNDGWDDVATANWESDDISVFLNDGHGAFEPALTYATQSYPYCIRALDVDNDNDVDLIVSNKDSHTLSFFINDGYGSFSLGRNQGVVSYPKAICIDDFDNDGYKDIALSGNDLQILLNDHDGSFISVAQYDPYFQAYNSGDIDGDGDVDLVLVGGLAGYVPSSVIIMSNNGDGTFANSANYSLGESDPKMADLADLDSDGDIDIITANYATFDVSVLRNNGDGTFQEPINYQLENRGQSISAVDINRDGLVDLVVGEYYLTVFFNEGNGALSAPVRFPTYGQCVKYDICTSDFDHDGDIDIAAANNPFCNCVTLYYNGQVPQPMDVSINPDADVSFGSVGVGHSRTLDAFSVANNGNNVATVSVMVGSPFEVVGDAVLTIQPHSSQNLTLRFTPASSNEYFGEVQIDCGLQQYTRPVSGVGVQYESRELWLLWDSDPDYSNPPFDDSLVLLNDIGAIGTSVTDINFSETIGGRRYLVTNPDGEGCWVALGGLWRCNNMGDRSSVYSNVENVCVDEEGTVYGLSYSLLSVFNQEGTLLNTQYFGSLGTDLVASARNNCLWTVGKDIRLYDCNLVHQFTIDPVAWYAVSVDIGQDGSAWIVERLHEQVSGSIDRLMRVTTSGEIAENIELSFKPSCVRVDRATGVVWMTGFGDNGGLYSYDPNVGDVTKIDSFDGWTLDIDRTTGLVACATRNADVRIYTKSGVLKWFGYEHPGLMQSWVAFAGTLPNAPVSIEARVTCDTVELAWPPVEGASGYCAFVDTDSAWCGTDTVCAVGGLDPVSHSFAIKAYNEYGYSALSDAIDATPVSTPGESQPLISPGVNHLDVLWPQNLAATRYELIMAAPTAAVDTITLMGRSDTSYSYVLPLDSNNLSISGLYSAELICTNDCGRSDALADSIELYHIAGQVVDRAQGDTLRNVWVFIGPGESRALSNVEIDSSLTNDDGFYRFVIAPGTYEIWRDSLSGGVYCVTVTDSSAEGKNFDVVTDVREIESSELPESFSLSQNYPNPFNPTTQIEFEIPKASFVEIHIYNMLGQQLRTLVSERLSAGRKVVTWDGTDDRGMPVASGVYFYRISTDGYAEAKKMILLK